MSLQRNIVTVLIMVVLLLGSTVTVLPSGVSAATTETDEATHIETNEYLSKLLVSLQVLLQNLKNYVNRKSLSAETCVEGWQQANLTWFSSYPELGGNECHDYNGCEWAGKFAGIKDKQSETWVSARNIAAVHEDFYDEYKGKWLVIHDTETGNNIKAQVLDMCSDSDCDGCCTRNMRETGFLIDLEKYTAKRFFGEGDLGNTSVDWCVYK